MTIAPETLLAYADGELGPIETKRVERAMADDPAVAAAVARHRRLADTLRAGFAPVADAPVPPAIAAMLGNAVKVTPLRARRSAPRRRARWIGAIAASLVVGVLAGQLLPHRPGGGGLMVESGGTLAHGAVTTALGTQLASTQAADAPVRIGISFRNGQGALCRTFEQRDVAGIACAQGADWRLVRLYGGSGEAATQFRQAASHQAPMMADAQAMAAGAPLDATQERQALATMSH